MAGSWHSVGGSEAAEGGGGIIHTLEVAPQGLGSGARRRLCARGSAELGDRADHPAQRGGLLGRRLRVSKTTTAFHWSSSKATVHGRSGPPDRIGDIVTGRGIAYAQRSDAIVAEVEIDRRRNRV
jgi:hypothetical protein